MNQTVTIELNVQQLNIVLAGLGKLPIEAGLETLQLIQQQAQTQLQQPQGPLGDKVISQD